MPDTSFLLMEASRADQLSGWIYTMMAQESLVQIRKECRFAPEDVAVLLDSMPPSDREQMKMALVDKPIAGFIFIGAHAAEKTAVLCKENKQRLGIVFAPDFRNAEEISSYEKLFSRCCKAACIQPAPSRTPS